MGVNVRIRPAPLAQDRLRTLLDVRDEILRKSGFRDIEYRDGSIKSLAPQTGRHDLRDRRIGRRKDSGERGLRLSGGHDHFLAAYWRFPWRTKKHREIARMLGEGASWRNIASKQACSFKTVAAVTKAVQAWEDPDDAE